MRPQPNLRPLAVLALAAAALVLAGPVEAQRAHAYQVKITNLTRGQVISPPIVVSHRHDFRLWQLGQPAIPEVAAVAEDGDGTALLSLLAGAPGVHDFAMAPGMLAPGETVVLELQAGFPFAQVTALGMLVTTNDAFFGLQGVDLPPRRMAGVHHAYALDAGSEANNEDCAFVPGPPCGNPGVRATDGAEGFVHVHAGIHGVGDLVPATHDWRNPVVEVVIQLR